MVRPRRYCKRVPAKSDGADRSSPPSLAALRVRPTAGSTLLVIAAFATSVVVIGVFSAARRTFAWTFATVIVAWLLSGVIAALCRRIRRGVAVALTVVAVVVLVSGTWIGVVASLRTEVGHVRTSLPAAAEKLERRYESAARFRLSERVQSFIDALDERFSTRAAVSRTAGTAPAYFVCGVLLLFLLGYGTRYANGALHQIRDPDRRATVGAVVARASSRARAYTLLMLLQAMIVVVLSSGVFYAVGLPAPFVVGLLVGALGAIPFVGVVVGGIPALLLAVADGDLAAILAVIALLAVAQGVEAFVIRPHVDARTVRIGPAIALIVGLIGFQLYGIGGATYSVIAAIFAVALLDAHAEWAAA